jgi:hypothetical protein
MDWSSTGRYGDVLPVFGLQIHTYAKSKGV